MAVHRVSARWTGFQGAPGYSNFHFSEFTGGADPDQMIGRVAEFFEVLYATLASQVTVTVSSIVEEFDETTGQLTGYLDGEEDAVISATGSNTPFSGPSGAVVNWLTNTVSNGRRVRGRTFLVPLRSSVYENDGTLSSGTLTTINEAAEGLVGGDWNSEFVVWSRPTGGSGGVLAPVTGHRVPDMAAVLRSRRD